MIEDKEGREGEGGKMRPLGVQTCRHTNHYIGCRPAQHRPDQTACAFAQAQLLHAPIKGPEMTKAQIPLARRHLWFTPYFPSAFPLPDLPSFLLPHTGGWGSLCTGLDRCVTPLPPTLPFFVCVCVDVSAKLPILSLDTNLVSESFFGLSLYFADRFLL